MSLLGNQTLANATSAFFTGRTTLLTPPTPTTSGLYFTGASASNLIITSGANTSNVFLINSATTAIEPGKPYQVTVTGLCDPDWASYTSVNGPLIVTLQYKNPTTLYAQARQANLYSPSNASAGVNYFNLTLNVETLNDATAQFYVGVANLTGVTTNSNTTLQLQNISVTELPVSATIIPNNILSNVYGV
jgi:hypothetical protein